MNQGIVPKVRPEYMNKLNRRECSTIIKIRSRVISAKSNMMASHNNALCRLCNDKCETQEHLLAECKEINLDKKIEYQKAFNNNDIEALTKIAEKNKRNHECRPPRKKKHKMHKLPNRVSYPAIRGRPKAQR